MPLNIGDRIGPFEVTGTLGAGGMGEVWRARDTRLDREVALKVLPETFAADPDRLARFEREAKLLAALNHPHIGGIHGLEELPAGDDAPDAPPVRTLVLELIEGETLAERIERGQISSGGGMAARWRGDGRELYYLDPDGMLMAVDIAVRDDDGTPVIEPGSPRALFDTELTPSPQLDQYRVTDDGERFLVHRSLGVPTPMTVVLNALARLEDR